MSSDALARSLDRAGALAAELIEAADQAEQKGDLVTAIAHLQAANRQQPDPRIEVRLVHLRQAAFATLPPSAGRSVWPPVYPDLFPDVVGRPPEVTAAELTADRLGSGITTHGSLIVRGLLTPEQVDRTVAGIDRAFAGYDDRFERQVPPEQTLPWYDRFLPPDYPPERLPRRYVREGGGVWVVDSPRMMFELVELFEQIGLGEVITGYMGERPALSVKKFTLRRVPLTAFGGWHQDGAFMGAEIRTVNVWIALTDCGGDRSDAPALEIVPRRLDGIVETGTEGAMFDTFAGAPVAERAAGEVGLLRPEFAAGDALLFDDLMLHQTRVTPEMTRERYAVEAWFFAPSTVPLDQVPLVF